MTTKGASDAAVRSATGRGWGDWRAVLQRMGAADLPHREIAVRLRAEHDVPEWWAQAITVDYERSIGRRELGQGCDGDYAAGATKTIRGSLDDALAAWCALVAGRTEFDGVALGGAPRVTRTATWRYWRVALADGSRLAIAIGAKPGTTPKSGVAVNHDGIGTAAAAARWKTFWKEFLQRLV